jgi:hypothetical protein
MQRDDQAVAHHTISFTEAVTHARNIHNNRSKPLGGSISIPDLILLSVLVNTMRRFTYVLLLLCFAAPLVQADLKSKMSPSEFSQAGLHKLSAEELAALSAWIEARPGLTEPATEMRQSEQAVPVAPVAPVTSVAPIAADTASDLTSDLTKTPPSAVEVPDARFGKEQIKKAPAADVPQQITAKIVGEFRGWDGNTVFRLDNGQVWQQRVGGRYRSPKRVDPEVVIDKGRFGYYLKTTYSSRSVGVKRLR